MSFSSGSYSPPPTEFPPVSGQVISSNKFINLINDIATALSSCLLKDGTQTVTANIPMSTFKFTGVGAGTAKTDSATIANLQSQTGVFCTASGTDTILLTPAVAWTSYANGQTVIFFATGANGGSATLNVSSLGAKTLKKNGVATNLSASDIPAAGALVIATYHLSSDVFVTKI